MTQSTPENIPDFMKFRIEYAQHSFSETDVDPDPTKQFLRWLNEAIEAKAHEPNAMTLATATPDGVPSARIVLLKEIDHRGLAFFTNYQSRKGRELEANPRASIVFYWPELERQVRVEGGVERTGDDESDRYFHRRPVKARVGSAASPQSQVVPNRQYLEDAFARLEQQHPAGDIPRPPHWGGYRVVPHRFEFWQGRPSRLHDRIEYVRDNAAWSIRRVAP